MYLLLFLLSIASIISASHRTYEPSSLKEIAAIELVLSTIKPELSLNNCLESIPTQRIAEYAHELRRTKATLSLSELSHYISDNEIKAKKNDRIKSVVQTDFQQIGRTIENLFVQKQLPYELLEYTLVTFLRTHILGLQPPNVAALEERIKTVVSLESVITIQANKLGSQADINTIEKLKNDCILETYSAFKEQDRDATKLESTLIVFCLCALERFFTIIPHTSNTCAKVYFNKVDNSYKINHYCDLDELLTINNQLNLDRLTTNPLFRWPRCIRYLTHLTEFEFTKGATFLVTELPEEFQVLTNLRKLTFSYNAIETIANKTLSPLTNLKKLDLSFNKIKTLPAGIIALKKLKYLQLYNNQLRHLPKKFGCLTQLHFLCIANNTIFSLPQSFTQLNNLAELNIDKNTFLQASNYVRNLSTLEILSLYNCNAIKPDALTKKNINKKKKRTLNALRLRGVTIDRYN